MMMMTWSTNINLEYLYACDNIGEEFNVYT